MRAIAFSQFDQHQELHEVISPPAMSVAACLSIQKTADRQSATQLQAAQT
jgi:hypothetical protein